MDNQIIIINSTNNDQMIKSSSTPEDEEVEWIEVTDDEIEETQEEKQKNEKIEKQDQQNELTNKIQINITPIPIDLIQSEISEEKIGERLPDELSSISAVESDEQSEELTIPTTKDLLKGAAQKVSATVDNKENEILENIPIKIFCENNKEKENQTLKDQQQFIQLIPIEKEKESSNILISKEDKNNKENNFLVKNEENEKQKAAEKEAERLLKEIGCFGKKEEINEEKENKKENKIEENNITEIKIQPFFYPTEEKENKKNKEELLEEGEKLEENSEQKCQNGETTLIQINQKEEKVKSEEQKNDEIKFFEVHSNNNNKIPLISPPIKEELNNPASVNYLIPIENKEEKILTEKIILPSKEVKFKEENKEKDELTSLDEYEQKLRRRSKEALELVDKICGLQVQENEKKSPITRPSQFTLEENKYNNNNSKIQKNELKEALNAGIHGLSGNDGKGIEIVESAIQIGGGPIFDVECVSVSSSLLSFPMDCLLLPENILLIVDSDEGLLLISMETKKVLKQIKPKQNVWRNPECVCIGNEGNNGEEQTIFVLLEYNISNNNNDNNKENKKDDNDEINYQNSSSIKGILKENKKKEIKTEWRHFICQFSISNFSMLNRIETPKWLKERVIWNFKICSNPLNKFIYLAANTPNQGFLFELNCLNGHWIECKGTRKNSQFADVNYFASIGPITELLLVETNRSYVQLISIYNSTVVSTRILGICERPGSLCIDNFGNLLIFDKSTSSVGLYSKAYLEKIGDLAFIERANCQLNARDGIIAILCKITKELRLHKYGDKLKEINKLIYGNNEENKKNKKFKEEEEDEEIIIREPIPLMRA